VDVELDLRVAQDASLVASSRLRARRSMNTESQIENS
jgi:hypothetical protein